MISKFIGEKIDYDGSQLRSHWILDTLGEYGDSAVAFIGGCDVSPEHMVDKEDLLSNSKIFSEEMLHFIVEHFAVPLQEIVLRQRLLICILKEALEEISDKKLLRTGDDLFLDDAKLTISIATVSPVSGLIHAGINISSRNTPVKTMGLADLDIKPLDLAKKVLSNYCKEMESVLRCVAKVRWVK